MKYNAHTTEHTFESSTKNFIEVRISGLEIFVLSVVTDLRFRCC